MIRRSISRGATFLSRRPALRQYKCHSPACSVPFQSIIRQYSDTKPPEKQKPYYVTSPIFYVNAAPHVGHLYTMVITDVLKRWQILQGRETILCTGTDEHGMKIQQAAAQAGQDPKTFTDSGADLFKNLADTASISYDRFFRTTDPDHVEAVQYVWRLLREKDFIYAGKHEGWYSVSDETFYPDSGIAKTIDPQTGQLITVSKETGKIVEWTSEENYHFRMSALQPALLQFYEENPTFIVPESRMREVVAEVSNGLEDLSISRPRERLSWGIPVPNNDEQTIYVWLDALINYITASGFPWTPGQDTSGGWPADVQVIGKDIVRFHCIYWPTFLLAIGLQPPKQILTHAHWTMGHKKMSKSSGLVVNPFHAMARFGVDAMRFYLCHDGGISDDSDYSNEEIITRYKKCLQSQVGSLLTRVCSKRFSLEEAIKEGEGIDYSQGSILHTAQRDRLLNLPIEFEQKMNEYDFPGALKAVLHVVAQTHKYLHVTEPWEPFAEPYRNKVMYLSAEAMRLTGILLQPFMPDKMKTLLDQMSVAEARRTFECAKFGSDFVYGMGSSARIVKLFQPLNSYD